MIIASQGRTDPRRETLAYIIPRIAKELSCGAGKDPVDSNGHTEEAGLAHGGRASPSGECLPAPRVTAAGYLQAPISRMLTTALVARQALA
jgi:hypothetical protein